MSPEEAQRKAEREAALAALVRLNQSRGLVRDVVTGSHGKRVWNGNDTQQAYISECLREILGEVAVIAEALGLEDL